VPMKVAMGLTTLEEVPGRAAARSVEGSVAEIPNPLSAEHGFEDFAAGGAFGLGFPQARSSLVVAGSRSSRAEVGKLRLTSRTWDGPATAAWGNSGRAKRANWSGSRSSPTGCIVGHQERPTAPW